MSALRFLIPGYLTAVAAGFFVGASHGAAAGWFTAWLGGGALSVLFAALWWTAKRRAKGRDARAIRSVGVPAGRDPA